MHQPGALANASTAMASMAGSSEAETVPVPSTPAGAGAGGGGGKNGGKGKITAKRPQATMRKAANSKLTAVAGKFTEMRVLQSEVAASERLLLL